MSEGTNAETCTGKAAKRAEIVQCCSVVEEGMEAT
jgi:hypothetical protein